MDKPLQVYLDSSDFSILSDPRRRTSQLESIEKQLLLWQSQGLIEMIFSYTHVIECAPYKSEDVGVASLRLKQIKKMCGSKCLISPIDLIEIETKNVCSNSPDSKLKGPYRDDGCWFPNIDVLKSELKSTEETCREIIAEIPDRKKRREAKRSVIGKDGKVTKLYKDMIRDSAPAYVAQVASAFPLSPEALEIAYEVVLGRKPQEMLWHAIKNSFADLEVVAIWYEKQWEKISPISSHLREVGTDFKNSLARLANTFQELHSKVQNQGLPDNDLTRLSEKNMAKLLKAMPANLIKDVASKLGIEFAQMQLDWNTAPSILTVTTLAAHVGRTSAMLPASKRVPKVSDFGDIFHTLNLPHVDVYRADGYMSSVIKNAKLPFKTCIASRLEDLPQIIADRLLLEVIA